MQSWKGETSVKERFVLPEEKVLPFLTGKYTLEEAVEALREKGKSEEEIAKFSQLFEEVQQTVDSKQLQPMVRTQYMRTAFQVTPPTRGPLYRLPPSTPPSPPP